MTGGAANLGIEMTPCQALLKTVPKDIAEREWVKEAIKILRKHEPMDAALKALQKEYKAIAEDPIMFI